MSRRSKGTAVDAIGPCGNGFRIPREQRDFILVAGGMGIAPLVCLCDELAKFRKKTITVILGAKTKDFITCDNELKELGAKVLIVTEDGSEGQKGLATNLLEDLIGQFDLRKKQASFAKKAASRATIADYRPDVGLYACGPKAMLKAIALIARRYNLPVQASLEERMGCGLGACLGCAIKTKSGYRRVCKDGPVFDLEEILWE
jgi:dihydroorotate dehydrogenase electron transfer subunit